MNLSGKKFKVLNYDFLPVAATPTVPCVVTSTIALCFIPLIFILFVFVNLLKSPTSKAAFTPICANNSEKDLIEHFYFTYTELMYYIIG